jgi:uncharacterized protein (DUF697 family)/predicted GTPase
MSVVVGSHRVLPMFRKLKTWFPFRRLSDEEYRRQRDRLLDRAPVPVFWLFGKTGSGKTSLVKYLTGAERAEIGSGFRPQTERSEQYDFPSPESPLVRFLDTRGLGETRYDPSEDIRQFTASAHVVIVTVRALDHALAEIVEPLRAIRKAAPTRPVLLAVTCLHEGYPGRQHPQPDPFDSASLPDQLPTDLRRSITAQDERFAGLVDRVVPLDLTQPEDGFGEPDFGGARLKAALLAMLPAAYRQTLLTLHDCMASLKDLNDRLALPIVIGHSMLAATAAAVPLPWLDIPVVAAIQTHLVYRLAGLYGQQPGVRTLLEMAGPIGGRLLARQIVRETLKFIPFVGVAANAALAYAYTYGLGKACGWYFGQVRQGNAPSARELEQVWHEQLVQAAQLWKKHRGA